MQDYCNNLSSIQKKTNCTKLFLFQNNLALALSLYGVGDLVMRILFIFLSNWLQQFGSQELYILSVTIGLVSRLGKLKLLIESVVELLKKGMTIKVPPLRFFLTVH